MGIVWLIGPNISIHNQESNKDAHLGTAQQSIFDLIPSHHGRCHIIFLVPRRSGDSDQTLREVGVEWFISWIELFDVVELQELYSAFVDLDDFFEVLIIRVCFPSLFSQCSASFDVIGKIQELLSDFGDGKVFTILNFPE